MITGDDCDDGEPLAWTDAPELCDAVDNNCDGVADEAPSCDEPEVPELCDGLDNDGDGEIDEDAVDAADSPTDEDGDGFGAAVATTWACIGVDNTLDCDDTNPAEPVIVDLLSTASSPDGSAESPFLTIQEGIDLASMCVVVYPGAYLETIDFGGRDLLVESVEGAKDTVIAGTGSGSVASFTSGESNAAELRGFTLSGGTGTLLEEESVRECGSAETCYLTTLRYKGGVIYINEAAPTLTDLVVSDTSLPGYLYTVIDTTHEEITYSYGGGIFLANTNAVGTVRMDSVSVVRNEADRGGGIYVGDDATLEFVDGHISYNKAETAGGGIAIDGASATVRRTVLAGNRADEEGGACHVEDGTATLDHVTSVGNEAYFGAGFGAFGAARMTLTNSIVSENSGSGVYVDLGAVLAAAWNNVWGSTHENWGGVGDQTGINGTISGDPQFVLWTTDLTDEDDLHLQEGSPSIDAGDPGASNYDDDGTVGDMGAYGGTNGSL